MTHLPFLLPEKFCVFRLFENIYSLTGIFYYTTVGKIVEKRSFLRDEVKAVKPSNDTAHLHFENILLEEKPQDQVWSSEEVSKALRRDPGLEEEPQGLELDDRVRPKGVPPQNPEPCTSLHKSGNFVFVSGLPVTNSEPGSVEENVNAVFNTMEGIFQSF